MNRVSDSHSAWLASDVGSRWVVASAPPVAGRAGQAAQSSAAPAVGSSAAPGSTGSTEQAPGLGLPPGTPQAAPSGGMGSGFLFMMIGLMVLMIFMTTMTSRKDRKKREALMSSLGRYDRVQTVGGVIGTIVEIKDDEVVLKVDESTNTKITFAKSAVQGVLKPGPGSAPRNEEAGAAARA